MIDLGKSTKSLGEPAIAKQENKVYYPTLRISDVDGLADLPEEEFTFTAKGKLISYSEDLKNGTCSCEIEIHSISPNAKKVKKQKDADERLDESFDKIAKKKKESYDDEE